MSTEGTSPHAQAGTAVLLPAAAVALYSRDPKTLESARNLEKDWRFARVEFYIQDGDVETGIETLKGRVSPNLLILQTDTIDDTFTSHLETLAGCCEEGTSAIVIGPDNDVNLYRRLIDMGVSDYLVRPIETGVLGEVIAKALIGKIGTSGSQLMVFTGAKGGVGTTVMAQMAASTIADLLGQKTMVLDAAGGSSTMSVGMGFEPLGTLAQAVRAAENQEEEHLKRLIVQASEKLSVLGTGSDGMMESVVTPQQFERLIDRLMAKYPVVVLDVSQAPSVLQRMAMVRANQISVVTTPTLPALRLARALMSEIKDVRGGRDAGLHLLVNMQGMAGLSEVSKGDLEKAMERKPALWIPFDAKMVMGNENEGRRLAQDKAGRVLAEGLFAPFLGRALGLTLREEKGVPLPQKGGFMGRLFKKVKS